MSSLSFLGNATSYLRIPNSPELNFGTGDFTIEWYQYQRDSYLYPRVFQIGTIGQRTTSIGKILRKYSIDELPQLWNVLIGDMSLIGPRPLLVEYLEHYTLEQKRRHEVMPGITGWAQIHGRNALQFNERFKLDVWYVDNVSFKLDVFIFYKTIIKIFKSENVLMQDPNKITDKY